MPHYHGQSGKDYHEEKHAIDEQPLELILAERKRKLQPYIGESDVVLDYGTGCGWCIIPIRCKYKYAYDVAEHLEREVFKYYKDIDFLLSIEGIGDQSCDTVICHHVLEHMSNPAEALSEMSNVLVVGGKLILCVPYEYQGRFSRRRVNDNDHHLYAWNVQSLVNLVEHCGFEIEDVKVRGFGYERFLAVRCHRYGRTVYRVGLKLLRLIRPVSEIMIIAKRPS